VIVPAGGTIDGSYSEAAGTKIRCLAPIGNSCVLQRVVTVLRATTAISTIVVAAPDEVHQKVDGVDFWALSGSLGTDSIRNALKCLEGTERVLICTSDLPFLTPEAVADFIERSDPTADISIGLVKARDYNQTFPDSPASTFVSLKETGPITIGCLFFLTKAGQNRVDPWLDRLFNARKSLLQSALLLGPIVVGQLITRRLSIKSLQHRAKQLIGLNVDIVLDVSPQLAFDIDTLEDYEYARTHIID